MKAAWGTRRLSLDRVRRALAIGDKCDIIAVSSGRGAARLARYNGVVEVVGSNPTAPTFCVFLQFRVGQERRVQQIFPAPLSFFWP
jgi:hypothetical protein